MRCFAAKQGKSKIQRQIAISQKNERSPTALPYGQKVYRVEASKKSLQDTQHTNLHKKALQDKKTSTVMSVEQKFFRSYVRAQRRRLPRPSLAIHSKERVYTVDSGASLHMMELSSLSNKGKRTVRLSSNILDVQTANGIVVSDSQAMVYIKELGADPWVHLEEDSPPVPSLGRLCNELGHSLFVAVRC